MTMRFLAVAILLMSGSLLASVDPKATTVSLEQGGKGWELVDQGNEMVLYEREVPGSDVIAFKGEGILDAPIARVASVILDNEHAHEWVDSLEESKIVRRISPTEYVEYNHIGTPFVMKDRDFVSRVKMEIDAAARTLSLVYQSADDPAAPKTDNIRGELKHCRFLLRSLDGGKRTSLLAEVHADPRGSVPKWIVNMFQRAWPKDTFKGIKKQLEKRSEIPTAFADVIAKLTF
jgi:hypothetical protein